MSPIHEHVIRDCVVADRLARGLADYYSRRTRGVQCPDLWQPEQRATLDSHYSERLRSARQFVQSVWD
jgi:hypothetical protein